MKEIFLGIKHYFEDCYHDRLMRKARKIGCVLADGCEGIDKTTRKPFFYTEAHSWKEGNIFYYILEEFVLKSIRKKLEGDVNARGTASKTSNRR